MPYSQKQIDFLKNSTHSFNVSCGAVSSGKTHIQILRWHDYVMNQVPRGSLLMMSGKTSESLYDNVIRDWLKIDSCCRVKYTKQPQRIDIPDRGIEIACAGSDNEASWGRIQGKTVFGWLADEVTKAPETFVKMAQSRCRGEGKVWSKFWTCNPENASHYIKTEYIDNPKIDVKLWSFELDDNPILSDDYKNELKSSYKGMWYDRYILGKWVSAEGLVYPEFIPARHIVDKIDISIQKAYYLAVDWGFTEGHEFTMLLIAEDIYGRYCVMDEIFVTGYRVSQSKELLTKHGWVKLNIEHAICDSADPAAIHEFFTVTGITSIGAQKEAGSVADGIQQVSKMLSTDVSGIPQLTVLNTCKNTLREFDSYSWRKNIATKAYDEPIKENDNCMDALRYFVRSRTNRYRVVKNNPFAQQNSQKFTGYAAR